MNLLIKITWQLTDQNTKEGKMVACLHATASCSLLISLSSVSSSEKQFNQVILTELWCQWATDFSACTRAPKETVSVPIPGTFGCNPHTQTHSKDFVKLEMTSDCKQTWTFWVTSLWILRIICSCYVTLMQFFCFYYWLDVQWRK